MIIKKDHISKIATMYLYTEIWWGWTAREFLTDINELERNEFETCIIHINSPGGSVDDGNAMFNIIKNSNMKMIAVVDGIAASMAAYLLMSFDEVNVAANARIMLHESHSYSYGNAAQLRSDADLLEQINEVFVDLLEAKTNLTRTDLIEKIKSDWWMSAKEAKKIGLVDNIINEVVPMEFTSTEEATASAHYLSNRFAAKLSAEAQQSITHNQSIEMKKLLIALGLPETATEEQAVAEVQKRKNSTKALVVEVGKIKGIVTDDNASEYEELADAAPDKVLAIFKKTAPAPTATLEVTKESKDASIVESLSALFAKGNPEKDDRGKWSFDDWSKNDPDGLVKMAKTEPAKYAALANR